MCVECAQDRYAGHGTSVPSRRAPRRRHQKDARGLLWRDMHPELSHERGNLGGRAADPTCTRAAAAAWSGRLEQPVPGPALPRPWQVHREAPARWRLGSQGRAPRGPRLATPAPPGLRRVRYIGTRSRTAACASTRVRRDAAAVVLEYPTSVHVYCVWRTRVHVYRYACTRALY